MPGVLMTAEDPGLDDWDIAFGGNDAPPAANADVDADGRRREPRRARTQPARSAAREPTPQPQGLGSAKLMTSDEIEQILRIQWAATHPMDRSISEHDYYYQSGVSVTNKSNSKNRSRRRRCARWRHRPRRRAPTAFVTLQGLGRVPFSNIRASCPSWT